MTPKHKISRNIISQLHTRIHSMYKLSNRKIQISTIFPIPASFWWQEQGCITQHKIALPLFWPNGRSYGELSMPDTDISFVSSSNRPSVDRIFPSLYEEPMRGSSAGQRMSCSDLDAFEPMVLGRRSLDLPTSPTAMSTFGHENGRMSNSSMVMLITCYWLFLYCYTVSMNKQKDL